MTIKSTWSERTEKARAGSHQRMVRRWYYVEGETGVSFGDHKTGEAGIYTSVTQALDSLKDAQRTLAEWQKSRNGLFWARIVRLEETKTVMVTKAPTHPVCKEKRKTYWPGLKRASAKEKQKLIREVGNNLGESHPDGQNNELSNRP